MDFFRTRHEGRGLALLALAMLLFSSFGHFHSDAFRVGEPLQCRAFFNKSAVPHCPPARHDHSDCPICSTMSLAGSAVIPQPPVLIVPAGFHAAPFPGRNTPSLHDIAAASFDARGPPSSVSA